MPPEGDYNSRGAADGLLKGVQRYPERDLESALLVYGAGDGGGGPGEVHLELTRREQNLRGLPRVEYSTADRFFRALEQQEIAHTHVGELYLETHQGTYTTQGAIKKYNRLVERKLHNAEALAALTGGGTEALDAHWKALLLNQFHDIIPGSSITRVNTEAVETYQSIDAELDAHIGELVAELPAGHGPLRDQPHRLRATRARHRRRRVAPGRRRSVLRRTPDARSGVRGTRDHRRHDHQRHPHPALRRHRRDRLVHRCRRARSTPAPA